MILITGSAGKTGRSVLQALVERGAPVRALIHQPEQIRAVESSGAQDVVVGDMKSQETMGRDRHWSDCDRSCPVCWGGTFRFPLRAQSPNRSNAPSLEEIAG